MKSLKIGTRGSQLALAQAGLVKAALENAHSGLTCELVVIRTSGDDFSPGNVAGPFDSATVPRQARDERTWKGLFVEEIEEALLEGRVDLAVHSVKDMETTLAEGLKLAAILGREDPRDALVSREGRTLKELPAGSRVGASSLRRQAQLKRLRRDLEFVSIRGNVDTRLRKLEDGEMEALVLAACGLIRLGLSNRISESLNPMEMLPAPGQGALGIEIRSDRREVEELVKAVDDAASHQAVEAERALLRALGGSCRVPVGALAVVEEETLKLEGVVLSPDGLKAVRKQVTGSRRAAERLGSELASHLRAVGADRLLYGSWKGAVHG